MCFDETDQIQHKISTNELKAKPIYCKQCNKVLDKIKSEPKAWYFAIRTDFHTDCSTEKRETS